MKRIILLLTICISIGQVFGQGNISTLVFLRPDNIVGSSMNIKIFINGVEIGSVANKSKLVYKTNISGNVNIALKTPGTLPKPVIVNIIKGKKQYFLVGFNTKGKFIKKVNLGKNQKNNLDNPEDVIVDNPKNLVTEKDAVAPLISITSPKVTRGFKLTEESTEIKITGKVTDESGIFRFTINGINTPVDENGDFISLQALKPGANEFKIVATDTQENTSEFSFIIDSKTQPIVTGEVISPTERRIALIIGNADYNGAPLSNPVNDAKLMSAELKKLGFEVRTLENGSQNQMKLAISEFGTLLAKEKNTVGLFYYAGHGIQMKGKNYLIPVDAKIGKEPDVEVYCVDLDGLLANLEYSGNSMNIIILDACRNNPFTRSFRSMASNGLATINAPVGTIIAYATAPGSVASDGDDSNGLYTQEFVKALSVPNLKIEDVFKKVRTQVKTYSEGKQIPWENSSIEGDFYFIQQK